MVRGAATGRQHQRKAQPPPARTPSSSCHALGKAERHVRYRSESAVKARPVGCVYRPLIPSIDASSASPPKWQGLLKPDLTPARAAVTTALIRLLHPGGRDACQPTYYPCSKPN